MAKSEYLTAPLKLDRMPPGVPFIVGNEAAERFSYYGMNSILVIFMTHYMMTSKGTPDLLTPVQAEEWYHTFVSVVYGLCLLGAFLADAVLGKYRTILFLSIAYCFGHFALAINDTRAGLFVGFALIALGAGGIKPCVSANVGDQFGASNQHLLTRVYSWFYFSINAGSAISTLLIPWLLEPYKASPWVVAHLPGWVVSLMEKCHGPSIAFGTPGIFMVIATIVFWLGRRKFVHIPPAGKKYIEEFLNVAKLRAERQSLAAKRPFSITVLSLFFFAGGLLSLGYCIYQFAWALWEFHRSGVLHLQIGSMLFSFFSSLLCMICSFGWRYGQFWAWRLFFWSLMIWPLVFVSWIQIVGPGIQTLLLHHGLESIATWLIVISMTLTAVVLTRRTAVRFFLDTESALNTETFKSLGNLLILVPFAAMFWALWQQNFSSWVLQAEKMDRHLFGIDWLPAQIQTVNPLFILLLLPVFSYWIYPAVNRVYQLTPLRKIAIGLFTTAVAFLIVALIQVSIDQGHTPNIIWQVLAFVVLTAAEVMVSVTHLEFAYTQAPKKMKSLVMCTYLGAVSLGNFFTAKVNSFIQNDDGTVKLAGAKYFFFFTAVMLVTAVLFLIAAAFYRGKTHIQDEAEPQPAAAS